MWENTTYPRQLTLFVEDSPVKMSVSPEKGRAWKEPAPRSGVSSTASFAKLGPDGLWLKTYQGYYQVTMDGSLETFSGTWPRAGMMQNGIVYQQQPLAPLIGGTGCTLLPTPRKQAGERCLYLRPGGNRCNLEEVIAEMEGYGGGKLSPEYVEWMMGFPIKWTG